MATCTSRDKTECASVLPGADNLPISEAVHSPNQFSSKVETNHTDETSSCVGGGDGGMAEGMQVGLQNPFKSHSNFFYFPVFPDHHLLLLPLLSHSCTPLHSSADQRCVFVAVTALGRPVSYNYGAAELGQDATSPQTGCGAPGGIRNRKEAKWDHRGFSSSTEGNKYTSLGKCQSKLLLFPDHAVGDRPTSSPWQPSVLAQRKRQGPGLNHVAKLPGFTGDWRRGREEGCNS
ncbi:unnamed protein product [Pleuronectes platessa]|uniref:Uncharacterized protein n=1 Tax=Pleuronectes platessa TaxID=8262 RepID=A0A9N7TSA7_PLEPL|nr:unnamed protein product [Pleuronectes platessa]